MNVDDLARLLSYREAAASVALDGETMHVAAPDGSCCLDHARERIVELEAEVEGLCERVAELEEPGYPFVRAKVRWDDGVLPETDVIAVWVRTTLEDLQRTIGMNEPGTVYEVVLAWCPVPKEATDDAATTD